MQVVNSGAEGSCSRDESHQERNAVYLDPVTLHVCSESIACTKNGIKIAKRISPLYLHSNINFLFSSLLKALVKRKTCTTLNNDILTITAASLNNMFINVERLFKTDRG